MLHLGHVYQNAGMHNGKSFHAEESDTLGSAPVTFRHRYGQRITVAPVVPSRYVLLNLATQITGYSVKAMERKIERGDWQEDKEWKRAPDGRICIDLVGYEKWVERQ